MSKKSPKVLVLASSRKTRGGITSVVKLHEKGEQWKSYHCKWIGTYVDRNNFQKIIYFLDSIFVYLFEIWDTDLVHVHLSTISSARRKLFFVNVAKVLNKKIIIHFHASPTTSLDSAKSVQSYPEFYRKLFLKADKVIVLSKSNLEKLYEFTGLKENVCIVFNPCPIIQTEKIESKEKYILVAGNISILKGYEVLIRAFSIIAHQYPDWKVIFAGNGEIKKAKAIVTECNINSQVVFMGWISGEEKDQIFKKSSFLCLPSFTEGMPMAILDAWAYGLPVVASQVGGVVDMINDGTNGLTFKPGDVKVLSEKLILMISDNDLRDRFSKLSFELSQTTYSSITINQQIGEIYEDLINN